MKSMGGWLQRGRWTVPLLVIVAVILLYGRMPADAPVIDDSVQLQHIRSLTGWTQCLGTDSQGWFRPLKNVVFYATVDEVFGVAWTKLACLGIFLVNILLAHAFFRAFFRGWTGADWTTALFALSPTMVSSVQFLSACNNQLCLSFTLIYLRLVTCWLDGPEENPSPWRCGGMLLSLAGALIAYEAGVAAVAMGIVLIYARRAWSGFFRQESVRVWGASLVLGLAYVLIRHLTAARLDYASPSLPPGWDRLDLILRAPYYVGRHALMWLEPWGRGGAWMVDDPAGRLTAGLIGWGLLLALILVLWRLLATRGRDIATGLLLFMAAMVPLANFLGLGNGPLCNYYLLIPGVGLAVALVAFGRLLWASGGRGMRGVTLAAGIALLAGFANETARRVTAWRSDDSLVELTLRNYPDHYYALAQHGLRQAKAGDLDAARVTLERARELGPWCEDATLYLAYVHTVTGDDAAATRVLLEYPERNSAFPWALRERLAEIQVRAGNWPVVAMMVNDLSTGAPSREEQARFVQGVLIPYRLHEGELDAAAALLDRIEAQWPGDPEKARVNAFLREVLRRKRLASEASAGE